MLDSEEAYFLYSFSLPERPGRRTSPSVQNFEAATAENFSLLFPHYL